MNRLAGSTSPYLRQHSDNPVDWWPWIPEAFAEAKRRDVPVHLSIGYAACHWCHVMARESFSDGNIAAQLNRDFVSIKVDREERPEVDQVYMRALHALGEQGGWPLTMFLTPNGDPFWGGTYFPPEPRYGRPGFPQILSAVSGAWKARDPAVTQNADALRAHLSRPTATTHSAEASPALLDEAAKKVLSIWDLQRGSFRGAPKFPNAPVMEMLWREWLRTGDESFREAVLTTLNFLCQGGIYDHLGGGLARYSVDANWLVPHFEKMLYDNAQLLSLLAWGFRATKSRLYAQRLSEVIEWLETALRLPSGGFASSLDADTDHEEGLTYVWSWEELKRADGNIGRFAEIYGATPQGNWEGKIILHRLSPAAFGWLGDDEEAALSAMRAKLLAVRNQRPQPARDDKILADWNGLAISGLARAAQATGNADAKRYATEAFRFVSDSMSEGDRLAHSFMEGELVKPGVATDYANMIRAALDLFALTGDVGYRTAAARWFSAAGRHHFDAESGLYRLAADDGGPLFAPTDSTSDEATPAATGTMAGNAATLFMLTGETSYRDHADRLVAGLAQRAENDPVGSATLQSGFDTLLRQRLAFVVGAGPEAEALLDASLREGDPALVVAKLDPLTIPENHPAAGKQPRGGAAALFLCNPTSCLPEIISASEVAEELRRTRRGNPMNGPSFLT